MILPLPWDATRNCPVVPRRAVPAALNKGSITIEVSTGSAGARISRSPTTVSTGTKDSAPMPTTPKFDRGYKASDSEWKILEELAKGLNASSTGSIHITSERRICTECRGVISQFRQAFPGIQLSYSDLGRE
jgi:hypothetical protein